MAKMFKRAFVFFAVFAAVGCSSTKTETAETALSSDTPVASNDSVPSEAISEPSAPVTVADNSVDSSNLGAASSGYSH